MIREPSKAWYKMHVDGHDTVKRKMQYNVGLCGRQRNKTWSEEGGRLYT